MFEIQCGKKQQDDRVCMGHFWICDKSLFHAGYRKTFHKACHSSIVTVIEILSVLLYK